MAFTTTEIGIELLMDVTNGIAEIHDRMTARAFMAVHKPGTGTRGAAGAGGTADGDGPDQPGWGHLIPLPGQG